MALSPVSFAQDAGVDTSFKARKARAQQRADEKDFAGCEADFSALSGSDNPAWSRPIDSAYSAACCAALAGHVDQAFAHLEQLLRYQEPRPAREAVGDADLHGLQGDARWSAFVRQVNELEASNRVSPGIKVLVDADQAERQQGLTADSVKRDAARRAQLSRLLQAKRSWSLDDLLAASLIFQHGQTVDEIARAHALAKQALGLAPTSCRTQHMVAITEDRLLIRQGKMQKYGTQYSCPNGTCTRDPVDPAVSDAQRAALCVPPLNEQDEVLK